MSNKNLLSSGGVFFLLVAGFSVSINAQSTFTRVTQILQSNCTASGCHGSTDTKVFDLSGSQQSVYSAIINISATNQTANAKGHKLVSPGYPQRSFLLRKIANGISDELALESSEGDVCPKNSTPLSSAEIELVRQWIMFGAPQTGQVIKEQTLTDYYGGKALPEINAVPGPPAVEGFQVHDGPIFLVPGEEREYQWKFDTQLPDDVEVYRVEAVISPQSHHLILYKYKPGNGSNVQEGHVRIDNLSEQFDVQINATTIATWQYSRNHELPEGTAYFWEAGSVLNSNYHVRNYDNDSILAADAYINVYTRPKGSGAVEMFSTLAVYGGFSPLSLNIPNSAQNEVLSFNQTAPETWYIWILQSHTHKHGKDYDIFLRNPDGSKGDQEYEGFYNYDQGYNQGFFDWSHPSVREFSPLLEVNMRNGLIHEATYYNDGPSSVGFGLTTSDEMFITYMHFTKTLPTGIKDVSNSTGLNVSPNPVSGHFNVSYNLQRTEQIKIELFNMVGSKVALLKDEQQGQGTYQEYFDASTLGLPPGIYLLRVDSANFSKSTKVVVE